MNAYYTEAIARYQNELSALRKKESLIRNSRFASVLVAAFGVYMAVKYDNTAAYGLTALGLLCFFILLRLSQRIEAKIRFVDMLLNINLEELRISADDWSWREHGGAHNDPQHLYSNDLDLFGYKSLFQFIHRTATPAGDRTLAAWMKHRPAADGVNQQQEAVRELSDKIDFRQALYARARLSKELHAFEKELYHWTRSEAKDMSLLQRILLYTFPIGFVISFAGMAIVGGDLFPKMVGLFFTLNFGLLASHLKHIRKELGELYRVEQLLIELGELTNLIENESFQTDRLRFLKKQFEQENTRASLALVTLGRRFSSMASIQNLAGVIVFSGTALYHLHTYRALLKWKRQHAAQFDDWLRAIGEFEALCSLAQFAYAHPEYAFPKLSHNGELRFLQLGHPLISSKKRVNNSVDLSAHRFIILTGSNMSGKSTFLRTLGVNMVLANMGAPVCAAEAAFMPMDILVSMRLSDSLADDASYFFAEVERLRIIFESLQGKNAFVLLDEILRGTNSDDKRNGTIEVIRRLAGNAAYGALATHDLEVCKTRDEFPEILTNKCFEVEIVDNDLHFDYRLREGICKNKSATFLMRKKGVI